MIKFEEINQSLVGKRIKSDEGCCMGWTREGVITSVDEVSEMPYAKTFKVKLDECVCDGFEPYNNIELFCRHDNQLGSARVWSIIEDKK